MQGMRPCPLQRLSLFASVIVLAFALVPVSCNFTVNKIPPAPLPNLPLDSKVDWNLMNTYVFRQCKDCHQGQQTPLLFGEDQMRQNIGAVWNEISAGSMPPRRGSYSALSNCEMAALKKWMDLGMPDESATQVSDLPECTAPTPPPTPINNLPLNYQTLKAKILGPRCVSCHCPDCDSNAHTILFEPLSELAGDSQNRWSSPAIKSRVIRALTRSDKHRMPPPNNSDPLSAIEIEFVTRWIDAGKPEF
jgi:hypothetical protein